MSKRVTRRAAAAVAAILGVHAWGATAQAQDAAYGAGRGEVDWQHGMTVWCGLADDRSSATDAVSRAMEGLYGLPFERFARYVPAGTPADVADALQPYVDAGCRTFNLLTISQRPGSY